MTITAIIQARTSSTRLSEKILKPLPYNSNITVLQQVIRRVKKSKNIDEIIIATTKETDDDKIVEIAKKEKVKYFRGSLNNVLERYYLSAKENNADTVVRITSDCPCIDWNIIDNTIEKHIAKKADYTSNTIIRTFPHGLDVEVISFTALEKAYFNATENFEKEHVCPYIHTTHNSEFAIVSVQNDENNSDIRITLDTEEDYALLCAVYDFLYYTNEFFEEKDIIRLFEEKPWLKIINKKVVQKKIFNSLEDEINEAVKILQLQDLSKVSELLEKSIIDKPI